MKAFVIIIDIILCLTIAYFAIFEFKTDYTISSIIGIPIIIIIILNILGINNKFKKSWLCLYVERKALEEKKKIDELSSK